ncbi:MAG: leucine-rich repeat domain-containing protein [Bacteroidales bacterium]|nr:leucine-rich repeat domain-containing protein [Bacteroidales bacterium]
MKKHLLTAAMLALAIAMTATSCSKDDDNKPADKTENTSTTPDDKKEDTTSDDDKKDDDTTPVAEKVTITLPDGSTTEVEKDSKYTVSAQTTTDDGLVVKFFVNGEDVSGKEITVSANTAIVKKEFATITLPNGNKEELEKGAEYTLPSAVEKEYIVYKIDDEQFGSGDKVIINKNLEISIVAKYQEFTFAELETADFTGKDEVSLKITDVTDENVGSIKKHLKTQTNLILAGEITTIGAGAFSYCSSLKSIVLPNSVESIEKATFASCTKLESIVIPNSVTSIKDYAFDNCWSLESVTIKNSKGNVTIGSNAFIGCPETLEVKYEPQSK